MNAKGPRPPRIAEWLLRRVVPYGVSGQSMMGDAREEYQEDLETGSGLRARYRYWRHVLSIVIRFAWRTPPEPARAPEDRVDWGTRLGNALFDVKLAARLLKKRPGLTLAAGPTAYIARLMRGSMLEELNQDYIRTARAKGLSESTVVLRHALRNAIMPVVSFLGPCVAAVLTGSVVVEKIFAVPGLGTHFVNGALNRDYTLVMGLILLYSALLVVFNLITDLALAWLDPRIRLQ